MASIFTHLLEGSNLAAYDKLAKDGDLSQLGVVGRNNTLINMHERSRLELATSEAIMNAETAERNAQRAVLDAQAYEDERRRDREEAIRLSGFKSQPKARRVEALPDSDEGVDDFLSRLF